MAKAETDETAKLFTGATTITCPAAGDVVGPNFTICGTFNASLKCPYRIRIRIHYINTHGVPVMIEIIVVGKSKWKASVKLTDPPAQGESILIEARGQTNGGVVVTPTVTTHAVFDSATTTDTCSGPCSA